MTVVLKVLVFLMGLGLGVQVVGGLLSLLDLWSDARRTWPIMLRAVAVWCGLAVLVAIILGPIYRPAFGYGLAGYFLLYILFFYLVQLFVLRNRRLLDKE
ncbi:MAG: hypothetical protein KKB20_01675 [Proteobacteria bacterium]|nr:hypothetical protein [Pseudomonadota bacterium]